MVMGTYTVLGLEGLVLGLDVGRPIAGQLASGGLGHQGSFFTVSGSAGSFGLLEVDFEALTLIPDLVIVALAVVILALKFVAALLRRDQAPVQIALALHLQLRIRRFTLVHLLQPAVLVAQIPQCLLLILRRLVRAGLLLATLKLAGKLAIFGVECLDLIGDLLDVGAEARLRHLLVRDVRLQLGLSFHQLERLVVALLNLLEQEADLAKESLRGLAAEDGLLGHEDFVRAAQPLQLTRERLDAAVFGAKFHSQLLDRLLQLLVLLVVHEDRLGGP